MASAQRSQPAECGKTLAPVFALGLGRAGRFLQSQLHPVLRKLSGCGEIALRWLADSPSWPFSRLLRGLLLLLLSAVAVVLSFTSYALGREVAGKIEEVFANTSKLMRGPFTEEDIKGLPEPVQRYFRYALKDGQHAINFCSMKQTGMFRLRASPGMRANEGWKRVKATQYISVSEPGYVWIATIHLAPMFWLRGWDSFVRGRGHMLWKLLSALPLVDFGGAGIDRTCLARYLSEAVFFPTALLPSERLTWEAQGVDSARATLSYRGLAASAVFHFNERGQVTRLHDDRRPRRLDDGSHSEDEWTGYYRDYTCANGIHVPSTMEAVWNFVGGDIAYAVLRVTESRVWGDVEAKHYLL